MEGGLVTTDDEELYHILLSLRAHGWTRDLPKQNHVCGVKSDDPFTETFRFVLPGYNVRPLELSGAIGVEQLKKLPDFIESRRNNGKFLQDLLGGHPTILIQKEIGESSWFGFSLVIRPGASLSRQDLLSKLKDFGFEYRPIATGNFLNNSVVRYFSSEVTPSLPNAEYIDQNGLFIGNHHYPIPGIFEDLGRLFS